MQSSDFIGLIETTDTIAQACRNFHLFCLNPVKFCRWIPQAGLSFLVVKLLLFYRQLRGLIVSKSKQPAKSAARQMNETGKRKQPDRRQAQVPVAAERRKVQRRRQIDPTTCEREYNDSEIEFMRALDEYKRANGRMFPTCSEILEVLVKLGYRKVGSAAPSFAPDGSPNPAFSFTEPSMTGDCAPLGLS
jgi:hypothetical protein